jgi:hypothetical protein
MVEFLAAVGNVVNLLCLFDFRGELKFCSENSFAGIQAGRVYRALIDGTGVLFIFQ